MQFVTCSEFDWQYPAITEKFAYECLLKDQSLQSLDANYLAIPWATIIDLYHKDWKSYNDINEYLDKHLKLNIPSKKYSITVCQTYTVGSRQNEDSVLVFLLLCGK